ncbi:MAG: hypothetical protein H6577_04735 [Lewinellaceae bacterium]|nr:hypothetical protein [Saprospiraceae bacterium]MCB9337409.1 hypothetical protein [Lewinellaceae bacterium]
MAKYKHTFNCIRCRGQLTFKSNSPDADNPSLPTLFHGDLEKYLRDNKLKSDKHKTPTPCMGRLRLVSSVQMDVPDFVVQIAPHHPAISYVNLPTTLAKDWARAMKANHNQSCDVASANLPANCTNNGPHNTDPRTGAPKGPNIGVREYYIGGAAGDRATARVGPGGNGLELFWSTTHIANTYNYNLIINIP